ncbi:hippurate hydrolase [Actinacidiphila yanglinensis]|uniref:Hippurate hydrolase n=1 Tax=Actinacidiphila yanglinensis TaxID=310779 RepID=A0A1H6C6Z0_9ACTN|nr:amidohydrolase [Actinacidiphila yanglinensis]SEG68682.1 hippurate hydrolase [Actinacidiphila yanglinensis]
MISVPPDLLTELTDLYQDLHRHPELSFEEHRTADLIATRLRALGCETVEGVGGTGVVGVLARGDGPTVLLRADIDALPVTEKTGLPYASVRDGVAHACGHDLHTTWLLGAANVLARHRTGWSGRLLLVFQPAEEIGRGARAMLDDGLYERFGTPAVAFGQHVGPGPAGRIGHRNGVTMAAGDAIRVRLRGKGGHGSRPESTVDPVVLAAATVLRLQTVVSREVAATDPLVLTIGSMHAGTKENIIPDEAELGLTLRSFEPAVRDRALAAIERIVRGEAATSGAPEPDVDLLYGFPALVNDEAAGEAVLAAFTEHFGAERLVPVPLVPASEDFGLLTDGGRIPSAYWFVRGSDPAAYAAAEAAGRIAADIPTNHSPSFAPVLDPTLATGVQTLVAAALAWLGG